ncbi:hypothetical protein BGZ93_000280 [Podila epicladia]|nr:hypothetical protein BGZ92_011895 [Podila epicladia]KAG0098377.1 hypothetical protein BGZ93_000280 [Podila epicladia]
MTDPSTSMAANPAPAASPVNVILAIPEVFEHVLSFLRIRQIRRLRLVCKRLRDACQTHFLVAVTINTHTLPAIQHFQELSSTATKLLIRDIDELSPSLELFIKHATRLSTLELYNWGLDIDFLQRTLTLCPSELKSLVVRNEGFVDLEDIVACVVSSSHGTTVQSLVLHVDAVGLQTHSLPWNSFRATLDSCVSLTSLSLGYVKVNDVPESLEETNALHATTATFPNLTTLKLMHCDISQVGLERLLRMYPNLKSLTIQSSNPIFEQEEPLEGVSVEGTLESADPAGEATVASRTIIPIEHHLPACPSLSTFKYSLTISKRNVRSQHGLDTFLKRLTRLQDLELEGHYIKDEDLLSIGEEWSRQGIRLRRLELPLQKGVTEPGLEGLLRMTCCRQLQMLNVVCSPDLVSRFWNSVTGLTELPCATTLTGLHFRKNESADRLQPGVWKSLNGTLKQLPRLVDLTIGTKLESFEVFEGLGRNPNSSPSQTSGLDLEELAKTNDSQQINGQSETQGGPETETISSASTQVPVEQSTATVASGGWLVDWSSERPFLQTLAIGYSNEFYANGMADIPRQIGRRFRFLEDFRFV